MRKLEILPYDPVWVELFQKEKGLLESALGEIAVDVCHVGSTSVPGLSAKAVIDIILEAADLDALDAQTPQMESLGYQAMGEHGIPGRRYFKKGGDLRTHHIHAFKTGDPGILRHIAFRDYLIAHPDVREAYQKLKMELAASSHNDFQVYWEGKNDFIKYHEAKALVWYGNDGPVN